MAWRWIDAAVTTKASRRDNLPDEKPPSMRNESTELYYDSQIMEFRGKDALMKDR